MRTSHHQPYPLYITAIAGLCFFLSGCTVGRDYQKPYTAVPKAWASSPDKENLSDCRADSQQVCDTHAIPGDKIAIEQNWWQHFHDPVLNQLIAKAVTANLDIKVAKAQISEARALHAVAVAALFPTGGMMASANRQGNQIGFPSGGSSDLANLVKQPFNNFKTGFDASWELDLFGGHRREAESAAAELEATAFSGDAMLISTLAEVARTYVDIRQYQAQLNVAQNTLSIDKKTSAIIRQRFAVGNTAGMDVSRAESEEQQDQAQIPYFNNLLAQAEYAMDILLTERPGTTHVLIKNASPVPVTDQKLILAAPAAVIANRPDIRSAERKLASATAQQGAAFAKFFPDISLNGFIGLFNTNAGNFLNVSSKSWSMGGNILWPILSYGSLSANIDAADARLQQAMTRYQKAVLSALSDVERAFTAYTEQQKHLQAQEKAAAADAHVAAIAVERFQQGLTSFLEVLDADRKRYVSENQLTVAKAQTAQNLIAVYKSLGGGWKTAPALAADVKQ